MNCGTRGLPDRHQSLDCSRKGCSQRCGYSYHNPAGTYLSVACQRELLFGIELMTHAKQKQRAMAMFRRLRRKPLLRITRETAEIFGRVSAQLLKAGRGGDFRIQDLWLASQAIQRDFTLLTANTKDFKDIPDLKFVAVKAP